MSEQKKMISIWFWVGLVLSIYGVIVAGTGIWYALTGLPTTVLGHLNPNLWWGGLMLAAGVVFLLIGKKAHAA